MQECLLLGSRREVGEKAAHGNQAARGRLTPWKEPTAAPPACGPPKPGILTDSESTQDPAADGGKSLGLFFLLHYSNVKYLSNLVIFEK